MVYEPVIGLEVHIQLNTQSKIFAPDSAAFGGSPNTHVGVITLAHPGTLPVTNEQTIAYAVKLGLACNCDIARYMYFDRKHYFYPDLPKGYQITQQNTPVCANGFITIKQKDGTTKNILLTRIHLEEDAGKSIHDMHEKYSMIDLNRAGVPLMEMVTEPVIQSAEDAAAFLTEVRKMVRYLGICDGNMEEGSLRCDANVSVREKGSTTLNTRAEIKNMNSIRYVQKAIEGEIERQLNLLQRGETMVQETRSYDAANNTSFPLRGKEHAHDYRYFPDPDIAPVVITEQFIEHIKLQMPSLANELFQKFTYQLGLPDADATVLTDTKEMALYFEQLILHTHHYKSAANWMLGAIKSYLNESKTDIEDFIIEPTTLAALINLVEDGKVGQSTAVKQLLPQMIKQPNESPMLLAEQLNILQQSDASELNQFVEQALKLFPDKVAEYQKGKKNLMGLFMGEVMKLTGGKADPKVITQLLRDALEKK